jgi:hypothetical protein
MARHFSGGWPKAKDGRTVGTPERDNRGRRAKVQPSLRDGIFCDSPPAINRRAIIRRPSGARSPRACLPRSRGQPRNPPLLLQLGERGQHFLAMLVGVHILVNLNDLSFRIDDEGVPGGELHHAHVR